MSVESARRSRENQKARKAQGELIVKEIRCGRLDSVADWKKEVSTVYRQMRTRKIPHDEGTRLAWVAKIGSQLAQMVEETRELQAIRERLQELQQGTSMNGQDFLPAIDDDADDAHENEHTRAAAASNDIETFGEEPEPTKPTPKRSYAQRRLAEIAAENKS